MASLANSLLVLVLLVNLFTLGAGRIRAIVHAVALQGVVLGVLPLLIGHGGWLGIGISFGTVAIKGVVIPRLLLRAMRDVKIRREVEPLVGPALSMALGAAATGLGLVFARALPLLEAHQDLLVVPASFATVLTGFLLITTRVKAVTQTLGYLVLENGIFVFGLLLLDALPALVEVGVLLDLVVAIFVMGIMLDRIHREFASLDTRHLSRLRG